MRKINEIRLQEEIEKGNISKRRHPVYPLTILNYSKPAEWAKEWNDITMICRGLVINDQFEIIAQPFEKFFNKGQFDIKYPDLPYEIFEKMDGWYGIMFFYDNKWQFASRGSFDSDQAIRCQALIDKMDLSKFITTRTYLFEIIHPETKIVVKYNGLEKLYILGAIETDTNIEIPFDQLKEELVDIDPYFEFTKKHDHKTIEEMSAENDTNREGYIIRFSNGFRMKIKFDEYCNIQMETKDFNNKHVWRMLREGKKASEIAADLPDEFHDWLKEIVRQLNEKFINFENELYKMYAHVTLRLGPKYTVKEFAAEVLGNYKKYAGYLFAIQNGTNYDRQIWNEIEPEFERTNLGKFKHQQNARRNSYINETRDTN